MIGAKDRGRVDLEPVGEESGIYRTEVNSEAKITPVEISE